jgi:hypothetical protein
MLYTLEKVDNNLYSKMEDLDQAIPIFLEDGLQESRSSRAVGMTKVLTLLNNNTGEVFLGPVQEVSLYHGQGLETLANELGDIEYVLDFVKTEEQHIFYQNDTRPYLERPETKHSFGVQERVSTAYREYKKDNNVKLEQLDERGSMKNSQLE